MPCFYTRDRSIISNLAPEMLHVKAELTAPHLMTSAVCSTPSHVVDVVVATVLWLAAKLTAPSVVPVLAMVTALVPAAEKVHCQPMR